MAPQVADTNERSSEQSDVVTADAHVSRRHARRVASGRLLDLKTAETYSGISAWTLRDLIASGDLPAVRPPRLRRVWIDLRLLPRHPCRTSCAGGAAGRHIRDPGRLRAALMITHVAAFYLLMRPQPKAARTLAGEAAGS